MYAQAVLIAHRQFVVVAGHASDARHNDRHSKCAAGGKAGVRIGQGHIVEIDCGTERHIGASVIHVVALNALIHHAEATTDNSFAGTAEVISKADAGTEVRPVIVNEALRYAVLAGYADTVEV